MSPKKKNPKELKKDKLIPLREAEKYCSYSQDYLSLRARQGKLKAKKVGRIWATTREWIRDYVERMKEYKKKKGTPKSQSLKEEPQQVKVEVKEIFVSKDLRKSEGKKEDRIEVKPPLVDPSSLDPLPQKISGPRLILVGVLALILLGGCVILGESPGRTVVSDLKPLVESTSYRVDQMAEKVEIKEELDSYLSLISPEETFNLASSADQKFSQIVGGIRGYKTHFKNGCFIAWSLIQKRTKQKISYFTDKLPQKIKSRRQEFIDNTLGGASVLSQRIRSQIRPSKASLFGIDFPRISAPQIVLPQIEFPKIEWPDISPLKVVFSKIGVPEIPQLSLPQIQEEKTLSLLQIKKPSIRWPDISPPQAFLSEIRWPHLGWTQIRTPQITLPQVKVPSIDLEKIAEPPLLFVQKLKQEAQIVSADIQYTLHTYLVLNFRAWSSKIVSNYLRINEVIDQKINQIGDRIVKSWQKTKTFAFNFSRKISGFFGFGKKKAPSPPPAQPGKQGMVIIPKSKDKNQKERIKEAFSDEVTVKQEDETSGIVKPVFKEKEGQEYMYILVPLNK